MSISTHSTHLSSSEIMIWMQEKAGELNDRMITEMNSADSNSDLSEQLANLKADLKGTKTIGGYGTTAQHIQELVDKYGNDPDCKELIDALKAQIDPLNKAENAARIPQDFDWKHIFGFINKDKIRPNNDVIDKLCDKIDAKLQSFKNDQEKTFLLIQDLNSQVNQTHQLASNLISSGDQCISAIIKNCV